MRGFLTNAKVLWVLGLLIPVMLLGFLFIMQLYDFQLVDEMSDPEQVRVTIAGMSDQQKQVHIWTTATLDVLFPLIYGGFFIGMAWRFFGRAGSWLALPGILVIPVDLTEGFTQVMGLMGKSDVLVHKAWLTPVKLGLFFAGAAVAFVAMGVALRNRFFRKRVS